MFKNSMRGLRYASQLLWQTYIQSTQYTHTYKHFPKQQVYQDTIKNYYSTQKCKHMKCCRSHLQYLSWLTFGCNFVKAAKCFVVGETKSLYRMSYHMKSDIRNISQVLRVKKRHFVDSMHASKDIHIICMYVCMYCVSYCDKYLIWMHTSSATIQ